MKNTLFAVCIILISKFVFAQNLENDSMKKNKSTLPILLLCSFLSLFLFKNALLAQSKETFFSARVSVQSDFQKADFKDISFPYEYKKHSTTTINFGIDALIEKEITEKLKAYIGAGYYRNKFTFSRAYDHKLLNIGTDSISIGTNTHNYTFHLFRYPLGISYQLMKESKYTLNLGLENIINFSFQQVYNGAKPFPTANNKYSRFRYYGNSILAVINIVKRISHSSFLELGPYVRVLNIYKRKDPILFDNNTKAYSRNFDGIGLSIKYSLQLKYYP